MAQSHTPFDVNNLSENDNFVIIQHAMLFAEKPVKQLLMTLLHEFTVAGLEQSDVNTHAVGNNFVSERLFNELNLRMPTNSSATIKLTNQSTGLVHNLYLDFVDANYMVDLSPIMNSNLPTVGPDDHAHPNFKIVQSIQALFQMARLFLTVLLSQKDHPLGILNADPVNTTFVVKGYEGTSKRIGLRLVCEAKAAIEDRGSNHVEDVD